MFLRRCRECLLSAAFLICQFRPPVLPLMLRERADVILSVFFFARFSPLLPRF